MIVFELVFVSTQTVCALNTATIDLRNVWVYCMPDCRRFRIYLE